MREVVHLQGGREESAVHSERRKCKECGKTSICLHQHMRSRCNRCNKCLEGINQGTPAELEAADVAQSVFVL